MGTPKKEMNYANTYPQKVNGGGFVGAAVGIRKKQLCFNTLMGIVIM